MNICEATKKALEENKCIREKPYKVKVKPIKGDVNIIWHQLGMLAIMC